MKGTEAAKSGRGVGRLALRRRKPFPILENRPGNRTQEGQREILAPIPRHGGAGAEKWPGVQRPCARTDGGILGRREEVGREAALARDERSASEEAMSQEIIV